jgi:hypothetical protein
MFVGTNLLETPISSTYHQLNKILCRHQPTRDTNHEHQLCKILYMRQPSRDINVINEAPTQ